MSSEEQTEPEEIKEKFHDFRFGLLLAALIALLIFEPILSLFVASPPVTLVRVLHGAAFGGLVVSVINAISARPKARLLTAMSGLVWLIFSVIDLVHPSLLTQAGSHIAGVLFLIMTVVLLLDFVFRQSQVTVNIIFASLCVYLLLGVIWAIFFSMIELVQPSAFSYPIEAQGPIRFGPEGSQFSLYYSFVTLTTLGYGDILPLSPAARTIAYLEALTGQLYLTVVVAWLVGLRVASTSNARSS